MTPSEITAFKQTIRDCIQAHEIQIYIPEIEDGDDETSRIVDAMPFAVIASSTEYDVNGTKVFGRKYPWGVAEMENDLHCDFNKLRTLLIR